MVREMTRRFQRGDVEARRKYENPNQFHFPRLRASAFAVVLQSSQGFACHTCGGHAVSASRWTSEAEQSRVPVT